MMAGTRMMNRGSIEWVDTPRIQFATTPRGKVAFQELGDANTAFVLVPPLAQHIEMMWEQPIFWRPIRRLASAFRFIQYDKLGTGLSDPSNGRASMDERLEELAAVLDAAGVERAWLGGFSEGGVIALAAAARMPERVAGLTLISTYSGLSRLLRAGRGPLGHGIDADAQRLRAVLALDTRNGALGAALRACGSKPRDDRRLDGERLEPRLDAVAARHRTTGARLTPGRGQGDPGGVRSHAR
jgi:pimeloyl-ACP methyl ester carboxylesterase